MIFSFARRMLTEVDTRLLWKFAYNFGLKGVASVERFKSRLNRGIHFPPFLFISVINSCNLRCQGCWVDVAAKQNLIDKATLNRYQAMDVNILQENIFHTKMMLKDFNLNTYLFGHTENDLQPNERKAVTQRLQREIVEIFNGTNITK